MRSTEVGNQVRRGAAASAMASRPAFAFSAVYSVMLSTVLRSTVVSGASRRVNRRSMPEIEAS